MLTALLTVFITSVPGAHAQIARDVIVGRRLEVHRSADMTSPVIYILKRGERVRVIGEEEGIARIRYRRESGVRSGFVVADFLDDAPPVEVTTGDLRVGLLGSWSVLSQGQRSFQTPDGVNWTTSIYSSTTTWPAAFVEWGDRNFWRFSLGLRRVDFTGHASADVSTTGQRAVEVRQNMISVRLEYAWTLVNPAYLSVGAEFARAPSLTASLGGVQLPTTSEDVKIYGGGSVGAGARARLYERWSGVAEARAGVYPTLSPMAYVFELALGAAYIF